jgi:putative PIN family toxin of toxin-antitoxin system
LKIIIDTNVLISAALKGRKPREAILKILANPKFEWVVSPAILDEYRGVLSRPKLKLSESEKEEWFEILDLATIVIEANLEIDFPRDRKDAKFLACAVAVNADYLLTGDRDFEDVKELGKTQIVSVSRFLDLMKVDGEDEVK